jgi:hypothetical protein
MTVYLLISTPAVLYAAYTAFICLQDISPLKKG